MLLIAGESLFNDGSSVVFFQVFFDLAAGRAELDIAFFAKAFVKLVGGAVLVSGFAIGVAYWTLRCKIPDIIKVAAIIGLVFFCMIFAEYPWLGIVAHPSYHFSGVIAVVLFGFWISSGGKRAMLSNGGHGLVHFHHSVAEFLAHVSNEIIFVVAGLLTWRYMFSDNWMSATEWAQLVEFFFQGWLCLGQLCFCG